MVAWPTEAKLESGFGNSGISEARTPKIQETRCRVIALVDTRTARLDEGIVGVVISTHERMASALAANLEFQRSLGTRGHVTTKILTLSRRLHEGETVRSEDVWQNP
jgi:hypothetical protein